MSDQTRTTAAAPTTGDPRRAVVLARAATVAYALALTTGTHWPRLQLGTEELPAPDKLVHWAAFGGLALLLWSSGWLRRVADFAVVLAMWAAIDELTQGIPGLGRTISWMDVAASEMGVLTVVAWRLALRPVGGEANRCRLALEALSWRCALASAWRCILLGAFGLAGAVVIALCVRLLDREAEPAVVLAGGAMGGLLATLGAGEALRREAWAHLAGRRACHRCAAGCGDADADADGRIGCTVCGVAQWAGQWQGLGFERARLVTLLVVPVLLSIALYAVAVVLYTLLVSLHGTWPPAARLGRAYHGLPSDLRVVIDLTLLLVVAAAGAARFRSDIARRVDGCDRVCLSCGHDLRGMVVAAGAGRCSECGRPVVRTPGPPGVPGPPRQRSGSAEATT